MKVQQLRKVTNFLLDLETVCEQYNITDVNFKIFSEEIEIYSTAEFLLILNDNFTGNIKNHEEYGYDAGEKFVIKLIDVE